MRRRPGGAVRVLDRCCRCSGNPPAYNVVRLTTHLPTGVGGALVRHELVVCASCEAHYADAPTTMERQALALPEAPSAVDRMEFFQRWHCDAARVQHAAAYFLGTERCRALAAELRPARERQREQDERWREGYREHLGAEMAGAAADEDDDLPF